MISPKFILALTLHVYTNPIYAFMLNCNLNLKNTTYKRGINYNYFCLYKNIDISYQLSVIKSYYLLLTVHC